MRVHLTVFLLLFAFISLHQNYAQAQLLSDGGNLKFTPDINSILSDFNPCSTEWNSIKSSQIRSSQELRTNSTQEENANTFSGKKEGNTYAKPTARILVQPHFGNLYYADFPELTNKVAFDLPDSLSNLFFGGGCSDGKDVYLTGQGANDRLASGIFKLPINLEFKNLSQIINGEGIGIGRQELRAAYNICTDGAQLYFVHSEGYNPVLYAANINGGNIKKLIEIPCNGTVYQLSVSGSKLFWILVCNGKNGYEFKIFSSDKTGGNSKLLTNVPSPYQGMSYSLELCVTEQFIFWFSPTEGVYRAKHDGSDKKLLIDANKEKMRLSRFGGHMQIYDGKLFWAGITNRGAGIHASDLDGGNLQMVVPDVVPDFGSTASDFLMILPKK